MCSMMYVVRYLLIFDSWSWYPLRILQRKDELEESLLYDRSFFSERSDTVPMRTMSSLRDIFHKWKFSIWSSSVQTMDKFTWSSSPSRRITYRVSAIFFFPIRDDTYLRSHNEISREGETLLHHFRIRLFLERLVLLTRDTLILELHTPYYFIFSESYSFWFRFYRADIFDQLLWDRVSFFLWIINIGKALLEVIIIGNFLFVDWVWLVLRH